MDKKNPPGKAGSKHGNSNFQTNFNLVVRLRAGQAPGSAGVLDDFTSKRSLS